MELGVSIVAADDRGAPRLIRAVAARHASTGLRGSAAAREHVRALAPLFVGRAAAADLVDGGEQPVRGGGSIVTFQQQVDGVDLAGGRLRVLVDARGALAAVAGTLQPAARAPSFMSDPRDAIVRALEDHYQATFDLTELQSTGERGGYLRFAVPVRAGSEVRVARVKRVLVRETTGLVAAWSVELVGRRAGTPDGARYVIHDAAPHAVISKVDLARRHGFRYRAYADADSEGRPFDGALASYAPHPLGEPDDTLPAAIESNVVLNAASDPWLPRDASTTRGNNVEAFANRVGGEAREDGDIVPDVKPGQLFNAVYDPTREPLASPGQAKAAAVNLFYVTNWLHDWYYAAGFTEVTGNAQDDNYGRGGVDGDRLLALAQDGADDGGRDNAFAVIPADGEAPSLHMLLWTAEVTATVTADGASYPASYFLNGPKHFKINGPLARVDDGIDDAGDGCEPIRADLHGKIALLDWRFACPANVALANAHAAGAAGVVLSSFLVLPMPGIDSNFRALVVDSATGTALGEALDRQGRLGVTLRRSTSGPETDGSQDNGIIAHEWGHYLHLRLAECEAEQCFAMSEGWADFVALHMLLRPGDDRTGTFTAGGVYAMSGRGLTRQGFVDPGYFGGRRYPYSTDRSKNPLGLRHIGRSAELPSDVPANPGPGPFNNEVHNAGEVWATMLWEAYNALIERDGLDEARRRMTDYVVAGLLLTPPNASFTEGRDALLAAVFAIDRDDMLVMARAFASRGAGTCAVSPPRDSVTFDEVLEDTGLAARLEASVGEPIVDDDVSCDHDGYLDRGERGSLRVRVRNTGVAPLDGVVVEAQTTASGVVLGEPPPVATLAPFEVVDLSIPVTILPNAPVGARAEIAVSVRGEGGCGVNRLAFEQVLAIGFDDVPESSTVDDVEATSTPWRITGDRATEVWSRSELAPGNRAWSAIDVAFASDTAVVSPPLLVSAVEPLSVIFSHSYSFDTALTNGDTEVYFDGGVIEISSDDGETWRDVGEFGAVTYPVTLYGGFDSPFGEVPAFGGQSAAYPNADPVVLSFGTQFAGQSVRLRFRQGTDFAFGAAGWRIDDLRVTGIDNTPFTARIVDEETCAGRSR